MNYIIPIILFTILIVIILIVNTIKSNANLKQSLIESYGKIPDNSEKYDIESVSSYWDKKIIHEDIKVYIDDITWDDLDMDKIFKRINACQTSIGDEYLYSVLREPKFKKETLLKREVIIKYLKQNPEECLKIQIYLAKFGREKYNRLYSFIYNIDSKSLKYTYVYKMLSYLPILFVCMIFFNFQVGLVCLLGISVINCLVYYISKIKIEKDVDTIQYLSSMLWCCDKLCKMETVSTAEFIKELKLNFKKFKSLTVKVSPMTQRNTSEIGFIAEYINMIFLYDLKNYDKIIKTILKYQKDFHNLYKNIGELDLSVALLSFRESLPFYTFPEFIDNIKLDFEEIYHPLLSNPIVNTHAIVNSSIITGSNASGKSTFIKALAINGILAQTLYTCTAKRYTTKFTLVITSMAVRDNILKGDSYFITEIKSLKRIIAKIEELPCICFIDEILKGTNTIERIGASASILNYMQDKNCLVIVASHDIELTSILSNQYDNYYFCEQITDNEIYFDYKLKEGVSQTRNAVKLLSYMGFNTKIINTANKLVENFTLYNRW